MPAYSFKERFVPFVKDGSKPHTIRARRKHPAKPGDTLYLYYGLRTKWCTKLREESCTDVKSIYIYNKGIILFDRYLTDQEIATMRDNGFMPLIIPYKELNAFEKNQLAWKDGFRPDGTTLEEPDGSFELMIRFWNQTHSLSFIGDIIYWDPAN